jgi:hypothetical protein
VLRVPRDNHRVGCCACLRQTRSSPSWVLRVPQTNEVITGLAAARASDKRGHNRTVTRVTEDFKQLRVRYVNNLMLRVVEWVTATRADFQSSVFDQGFVQHPRHGAHWVLDECQRGNAPRVLAKHLLDLHVQRASNRWVYIRLIHIHTHTHAHARTHTHTHTHAHAHTHTHTHTHVKRESRLGVQ